MHYITEETTLKENIQIVNNLKNNILSESDVILYLRALIFAEKPYLVNGIKYYQSSSDVSSLIEICNIFNLVLEDKLTEVPEMNFDLCFEGKYHSIVGLLMNTLYDYFVKIHNI